MVVEPLLQPLVEHLVRRREQRRRPHGRHAVGPQARLDDRSSLAPTWDGIFFGFEEIHYHIYIFVSLGFLVVQKQDLSHHFYVSVRPCFASRVL